MNVLEEILKLSKEDRIELVKTVWDSIEQEQDDSPLTEEQLIELRRRRAAYDEGNMPVYSWKEVKESITKKK
jgi:putative addiction module component (TIGR02574 family)